MNILLVLAVISVALFLLFRRSAKAEAEPKTTLQVFATRRTWKTFPSEFLEDLASKFKSVDSAWEFVALCENTGILGNNITRFALQDPSFALGQVATTLTSYANAMGEREKFPEAKRALEFALLLRPRHVSAWISMALVAINMNDCRAAVTWADKVMNFKADPNSDDPWEAGMATAMTPEGERQAAETLRDPELMGGFSEVREQMKAIKEMCRGKT